MDVHNDMTIGRLAAETRCTVPTIRYYEEIGLLPEADRRTGGHRIYGEGDLRRLTFIRRCRDFGFPIQQIRDLVALAGSPERDCAVARDVAEVHLVEVRRKLKELRALERSLKEFVEECTALCAGGPAGACVILRDLATPQASSCCGSESDKVTNCSGAAAGAGNGHIEVRTAARR
jgi:MerR family copper efflux transcriptional regulator